MPAVARIELSVNTCHLIRGGHADAHLSFDTSSAEGQEKWGPGNKPSPLCAEQAHETHYSYPNAAKAQKTSPQILLSMLFTIACLNAHASIAIGLSFLIMSNPPASRKMRGGGGIGVLRELPVRLP